MVIMARRTILQSLALCGYYLVVIAQSEVVTQESVCSIQQFANYDFGHTDEFGNETKKQPFNLEEIYLDFYRMASTDIKWDSDTNIFIEMENRMGISSYNINTMEEEQIVFFKEYKLPFRISTMSVSPDRRFVLVTSNMKREYRYSTVAKYAVLLRNSKTYKLIENGAPVSLAIWSPTNDLVYVYNNNIYLANFDKEKFSKLTTTGVPGVIYNGVADWVYEEEVFRSPSTLWFSPDGQYLAFATVNDTAVGEIVYPHYGIPGSFESQYPQQVRIRYPKAGTQNPVVNLSVITTDLESPRCSVVLEAPTDLFGSDVILYGVTWWNTTHLIALWTNRVQNVHQYIMYHAGSGANTRVLRMESWTEPNLPVRSGDHALFLQSGDSGISAGKFQHITRYRFENGRFTSPIDLTSGPFEVESIVTVDEDRDRVYYLATAPGKPEQRNLYWTSVNANQESTCLSCVIPTPEGNTCTYATAHFSPRNKYYALICTGPDPFIMTIHKTNYHPNDKCMGLMYVWSTFKGRRRSLAQKLMPLQRDLNVTVNGYDSRVRLLLPPDFDESKKYPMLVYVYGAPNTVTITDEAKYGFAHYLTTSRGVIYARIDARGSGLKGSKMFHEIYRHVGTVEIEDTIAVTAVLQNYSWIDASRTGIWGWSYGGFTTSMTLATDNSSVFACGISVAPVTNWLYYDSIYTERYMGLPTADDNLIGYKRTDVSLRAEGIRNKKFLLIHGSGDDNVHYQQSMMLAKTLEQLDIPFEEITYPDEAHNLLNVRPHFYHTMDRFWDKCFRPDRAR